MLLLLAAAALQPNYLDPANPVRVEGPTRICMGQISFEAEAGETVTFEHAGVHKAEIRVRGGEGSFSVRTGDMLDPPYNPLAHSAGRTENSYAVRYPTWNGIDSYVIYGALRSDPGRWRPIAMIQRQGGNARIGRWVLDRIDVDVSDPASCNHRLDYGRRARSE